MRTKAFFQCIFESYKHNCYCRIVQKLVSLILAFCSNCLTFIFIKNLTLLDHPKHPLAVKIYSLVKINEKKIIKNLLGNSFPFCLTLFHLIVSNVRSFLQMISKYYLLLMKKGRNYFLKFVIMISIFFFLLHKQ